MVASDQSTPTGLARQRFVFIPKKIADTLIRAGIRSWEQVASASDAELLALKGIGPSALLYIRVEQRRHGH